MRHCSMGRAGVAIAGACLSLSIVPGVAAESAFRVKDILGGSPSANPYELTTVSGGLFEPSTLFFVAPDGTHGLELWKSDGTASGTVLVKDIRNGLLSSSPSNLTSVRGSFLGPSRLYFAADDGVNGMELWTSDGTAAGTGSYDINPAPGGSSQPANLTAVSSGGLGGSRLFFTADDDFSGVELWILENVPGGLHRVKDIRIGPGSSNPTNLTAVGTDLYFTADDGSTGPELWKSDGTEQGTVRVKDIYPGAFGSEPRYLTSVGGVLFFAATTEAAGGELWVSDGTSLGTTMVKDIWVGGSSMPQDLIALGSTLVFVANDGVTGYELWRSDGSGPGTVLVADINPAGDGMSDNSRLARVGSRLFFRANDGTTGRELWRTDGTAPGTVLVKDIFPGPTGSGIGPIVDYNGIALFGAQNSEFDGELWRSDGRPEGTFPVDDIWPGPYGSDPHELTVSGRYLYFTAFSLDTGGELWATDLVFKDGFDSGLGVWSTASADGGDLYVHPSAALFGTQGLAAFVDDTASLFVVDESPNNESRYRARFLFDPNGFDPGLANGKLRVRLFIAFEEDPTVRLFTLVLRRIGSQFSLMGRVRLDDGTRAQTPFFNITDEVHMVEVDWTRSNDAVAPNGSFQMWIDEIPVSLLTDLDNNDSGVDFARLGVMSVKPGANGTLLFDNFECRRDRYIGYYLP